MKQSRTRKSAQGSTHHSIAGRTRPILLILSLLVLLAGSLSAQEFPGRDNFFMNWDVGEGWSETVEIDSDLYAVGYEAIRDDLTVRMWLYGNEPLAPSDNIDLYTSALPDSFELEYYGYEYYDSYLEEYSEIPYFIASDGETTILGRADFPDYYGVLTVFLMPAADEERYLDEAWEILFD
mgnify:CR=1 FL=1